MSWNPSASYWSQFSFRSEDSYLADRERRRIERRFEPHDEPTRRMVEQWCELYDLSGAETIVPLIDRWQWLERMGSPEEKQKLVESLIERVQREPERRHAETVFVLLTLEPIRRGVASRFLAGVRLGHTEGSEADRHRRNEARWLREMEA